MMVPLTENLRESSMLIECIKTIRIDAAAHADRSPLSEKEKEHFPNFKWAFRIRKGRPLSLLIEDSEDIDIEILLESLSYYYDSMIFRSVRGPDYTMIYYYGRSILERKAMEFNRTEKYLFDKAYKDILFKLEKERAKQFPNSSESITIFTPILVARCSTSDDIDLQEVALQLSYKFQGLVFKVMTFCITQKIQCYGTIKLTAVL